MKSSQYIFTIPVNKTELSKLNQAFDEFGTITEQKTRYCIPYDEQISKRYAQCADVITRNELGFPEAQYHVNKNLTACIAVCNKKTLQLSWRIK